MRALVFCIDDGYVMPFKVLWHSLMDTESVPCEAPVFILHGEGLSPDSIQDTLEFVEKYGRTAIFRNVGACVPDGVPLSHHINKVSYARLFIATALPAEISSAIYLDSDAIVIRSIRKLFEFPLTGAIAAADHMSPSNAFRLWGDCIGNYFQGGVFLADLNRWREDKIEKSFKRILEEERDRILWWDQDVLNIAFENDWQRLPIWYNLSSAACSQIPEAVAQERGCFLHLDGSSKPWLVPANHWVAGAWYTLYAKVFDGDFDMKSHRRSIWKRFFSAFKRFLARLAGHI